MGYLVDQLLGRLVLLHRRLVQLSGLAAQLFCHRGKPVRGGPEPQEGFVHRLGNRVQAAPDQLKIPLVVHLGTGAQITLRNAGQHLLNVGYVLVYALQRIVQGLRHDLQLISGADGDHLCVQVAVGEGHHPVCYPLHRAGDGPGKPQDQQYRDRKARQGGKDGDQHGSVDKVAVIRLGDLDDQRPLGPPDGREGHQHLLPIDGILHRSRFIGGDPFRRVSAAAAELAQRTLIQNK